MKRFILSLSALAGLAAAPIAQAGLLDGFYLGGGVQVVRGDFPEQVERRVGGNPNVPLEEGGDPSAFYVPEVAYITAPMLRAGWRPIPWVAAEVLWGYGVDRDTFNENPHGTLGLKSIAGIYLKPQMAWGNFNFYGLIGTSDFKFDRKVKYGPTDRDDPRLGERDGNSNTVSSNISDNGTAWGGGIELKIARQGSVSFEYMQHFKDGDDNVIGGGVMFSYFFGGDGEDDGYEDDYY